MAESFARQQHVPVKSGSFKMGLSQFLFGRLELVRLFLSLLAVSSVEVVIFLLMAPTIVKAM
jgi:hypothetical protein